MSDKTKFYKMTKPIKFRKLRLVFMTIVLWCKAQRERILYLFNYLLYKMNILQRYSYRDNVEQAYPHPSPESTMVTSKYFRAIVGMGVTQETSIHQDYFYRLKKDGTKKITYTVIDEEKHRLFLESYLFGIELNIADSWRLADCMPIMKVYIGQAHNPIKNTMDYKTVEYDLTPLRSLRIKDIIGDMKLEELTRPVYLYYYETSCRRFAEKLNTMSLADLTFNTVITSRDVETDLI